MFGSGISTTPVNVDFLTSSYRIVGKVNVSHTGLLGLLTAKDSSILEIHDAHLARLDIPNRLADRFEIARLIKQQIVTLCVSRREHLGGMAQAGLSASNRYPIHLITADYEIDGLLEWTGRFDLSAIISQDAGDFFPLYQATLSAIMIPGIQIDSPIMVVNRRWVDMIAMAGQQKRAEFNPDEEV